MKKASNSVWRLILVSLLAFLGISPVKLHPRVFNGHEVLTADVAGYYLQEKEQLFMPTQTIIEGQEFCLELEQTKATLSPCESERVGTFWVSPESWQVQEGFFADLNRDNQMEAVLLVRRPFSPWPIDSFVPYGGRISEFQDLSGYSCHVILLGWRDGQFKEVWAGSAMADPIRQLHAIDLDGDGSQELAALEYAYDENENMANLVIWKWNGFGFSLSDRLVGSFSQLQVFTSQHNAWLVTD